MGYDHRNIDHRSYTTGDGCHLIQVKNQREKESKPGGDK